jgi:uncharacterized membrane protein YagU involved in acid resistance
VGTLDITAAVIVSGAPLGRVCQFIASGIFGKDDAFSGGTAMMAWGLILHYLIAYTWTVFFFILYPRIPFLSKNGIVGGTFAGLFIWTVMNLMVLPLSSVPTNPVRLKGFLIGSAVLMTMIGMPLMFLLQRYYHPKTKNR